MAIISSFVPALQALLGPVAEEVATKHSLICRQRKFSATTLLSTFVLGYLHKPTASVADLAVTARALGVTVSPQALDGRFRPALQNALHDLWQHAVTRVVAARPRAVELLQRFARVLVGDSTTIRLADELADRYPGCGGTNGTGRAALKVQVQWDLLHGTLAHASLEPGRQPDATSPALDAAPPAGSLVLYDLGYFRLDRFAQLANDNVSWISRGLSNLTARIDGTPHDLVDWLHRQSADRVDRWVEIGAERLRCRLVALRAPKSVARHRRRTARRKAAKKGRQPRGQHLAACAWTIYLTNCPATLLSVPELLVLYRLRWQIELLFKLWKSHHRVADHRTADPVRQMIELFARLIAVVVQHWLLLTTGWNDPHRSLVKTTRILRDHLPLLIDALGDRQRLEAVVESLARLIAGLGRLNRRRKRPNAAQLLENPALQEQQSLT